MARLRSTLLLSLTTLAATFGSAVAQAPTGADGFQFQRTANETSDESAMRTCWYDENGRLTGSEPAASDAKEGSKNQLADSGAHSWSYTVKGGSEVACPAKLPVSTIARHT